MATHLIILGIVLSLGSGEPPQKPCGSYSVSDILNIPSYFSPQPTPTHLYSLTKVGKTAQVASLDLRSNEKSTVTNFSTGVQSYLLSPKTDKIAGVTGPDEKKNRNLFVYDIPKKEMETLASGPQISYKWNATGDKLFFANNTGGKTAIESLDLSTQKREKIGELALNATLEDVSPNNLWLALSYDLDGRKDVLLFQLAQKRGFAVFKSIQGNFTSPRFSKNSENLFALSGHLTPTPQVIAQPLRHFLAETPDKTQRLEEFVVYSPVVKAGLVGNNWENEAVDFFKVDSSRRVLTVSRTKDGLSKIESFVIEPDGLPRGKLVAPEINEEILSDVELLIQGNQIEYFYSKTSPTHASQIASWKKGFNEKTLLNGMESADCVKWQKTNLPFGNNLIVPKKLDLQKAAVLLLGQSEPKNKYTFNRFAYALTTKGHASLTIATQDLKEILAAMKYLESNVAPQKVKVFGYGKGLEGSNLLRLVQIQSDNIQGLILTNPVLEWKTFLEATPATETAKWEKLLGDIKNAEKIKSLSPYYYFGNWKKTPLLLINSAGENPRTPQKYYTQLADFMKKRNNYFEAVIYKDVVDEFDRIEKFLNSH